MREHIWMVIIDSDVTLFRNKEDAELYRDRYMDEHSRPNASIVEVPIYGNIYDYELERR